jgi:hypothetical protein
MNKRKIGAERTRTAVACLSNKPLQIRGFSWSIKASSALWRLMAKSSQGAAA